MSNEEKRRKLRNSPEPDEEIAVAAQSLDDWMHVNFQAHGSSIMRNAFRQFFARNRDKYKQDFERAKRDWFGGGAP